MRERRAAEKQRTARRYRELLQPKYRESTFEKDCGRQPKLSAFFRRYTEKWAPEADNRDMGLLLYGPPGTGKTFFAACIANRLLERGFSVRMLSAPEVLEIMESDSYGHSGARDELDGQLARADLFILDDFGASRDTAYGCEMVFRVIEKRMLAGKPFLVTTNLSPKTLMEEKELSKRRLNERVLEGTVPVSVGGPSARTEILRDRAAAFEALVNAPEP